MNPLLLKGSLVLVASSGAAFTGAYWYGAFSSKDDKSFRNYLNRIGRVVASSFEDWSKLQTLYDKEPSDNPIPNISKAEVKSDVNRISKWCEYKLKQDHTKLDADLVESWCSRPVSIGDRLSYFNLLPLNTSEDSAVTNGDDGTWDSRVGSYASADASLRIREVTGASGQETLGGSDLESVDKSKLKKWCDWSKGQSYKYETSPLFKKYKHWCSRTDSIVG